MEKRFAKSTFGKRLAGMLTVDFRRMFTRPLFYILFGCAFVTPVLILVMTTMMDGSVSVNPQTGEETVMEGFDHVFQIIGSISTAGGETAGMSMDLVSMCNINLLYFGVAALICIFIADDFRSGFAKNLFTVRPKKGDYVISKLLVCTLSGALLVLGFLVGALIGGGVAGLPFAMEGFDTGNLVCCVLGKMLMMAVFAGLYGLMAVIARQKLWLSVLLSLCTGMLLFNVVPMVTPLDAGIGHVAIALTAGVAACAGTGAISRTVLKKVSLV